MMKNLDGKKIDDFPYRKIMFSCLPETSVGKVLEILRFNNIGAVIVVDKNKMIKGIFTERDLVIKVRFQKIEELSLPISQFMTPNPICVYPESSLEESFNILVDNRFRHLVITDHNKKCLGIISIKDVLEYIMRK